MYSTKCKLVSHCYWQQYAVASLLACINVKERFKTFVYQLVVLQAFAVFINMLAFSPLCRLHYIWGNLYRGTGYVKLEKIFGIFKITNKLMLYGQWRVTVEWCTGDRHCTLCNSIRAPRLTASSATFFAYVYCQNRFYIIYSFNLTFLGYFSLEQILPSSKTLWLDTLTIIIIFDNKFKKNVIILSCCQRW